jgi:hypothetical protein
MLQEDALPEPRPREILRLLVTAQAMDMSAFESYDLIRNRFGVAESEIGGSSGRGWDSD